MAEGYQYGEDTAEQTTFELDFPYELTPDQAKSIDEILKLVPAKIASNGSLAMW